MELLACHEDSYADRLCVSVVDCRPVDAGYRVVLEQSIAYPGGGGQPADQAWLNTLPVLAYETVGARPAVVVSESVPLGEAEMVIDWPRRFDHMQQHTAQHVLTAVALKYFGWQTLAFHLNAERSDIVLDTDSVSLEQVKALETHVNRIVREAIPVSKVQMERGEIEAGTVRYRRLVEGVESYRVIDIDGVDTNPCGGTHVSSTAELQLVKVTSWAFEKGTTRMHFLAGQRALEHYSLLAAQSHSLTELLSEPPHGHHAAVERLLQSVLEGQKRRTQLERELGGLAALRGQAGEGLSVISRPEMNADYSSALEHASLTLCPDHVFFVYSANMAGDGQFMLIGPERFIVRLLEKLKGACSLRGGGRGRRMQGKFSGLVEPAVVIEAAWEGVASHEAD
ncbi:MAG: hypothetical protein ACON3Z_14575 [Bradymonadia bacterium]